MPKKPADPARAKLELAAAADRAEANRVVTKEEEGTDAITQVRIFGAFLGFGGEASD